MLYIEVKPKRRQARLVIFDVVGTEGLIGKAGLRNFFQVVLSTDDVRACKPDPRPYRMALHRAGCNPSEAWMVAAHGWDILGADALGMRTVWIDRVELRWPFPGHPPDLTASDLTQVARHINGDNRRLLISHNKGEFMEAKTLEAEGIRLRWEEAGKGRPVISSKNDDN